MKTGSLYVELEMDNATKNSLDHETIRYYSTIKKTERVFVTKNVELEEQPTHVCRILKVRIQQNNNAEYLLQYDDTEPGVRRETFWLPYWCVVRQTKLGRSKDKNENMITLRKRTKTTTYFKESSDLLDYNNEIGYFNKLYLTRVDEDECPNEPLNYVCNIRPRGTTYFSMIIQCTVETLHKGKNILF